MRVDNDRMPAPADKDRKRMIFKLMSVAMLAFGSLIGCDQSGGAPHALDQSSPATTTAPKQAAGEDAHAGHDHGTGTPEVHGDDHDEEGRARGEEHSDEVVLTQEAIRRSGIRVSRAKAQVLSSTFVAPARIAYDAEQMAHIGSVVEGRIVEIKARVGDQVKKGDVLLVVDSPALGEAQSDFLQKRTAVEVAQPNIELAQSGYDRAKELFDKNQGISLTEVQKRQGEVVAAKGALRSAEAAFTAAENRLHLLGISQKVVEELIKTGEINPKYEIRAPIDGRVIEREVTLGELVGPEKEKLMVLADLSVVWVLADVPEAKLGEVPENAKVQIVVPALGEQSFEGTVSFVSPELDPATRTARLRVEVPNTERRLRPGMFARAEVAAGGSTEPVVAISHEAVQTVEGEPAVFVPVEGEPNTFAKREVGVGSSVGGMVPVFAGLKAGEKYVSSGSFLLKAELGKAGAAHEH